MTKENRVFECLKHDPNYYRNMIILYKDISSQDSIPNEIIIPVYEYLYELGISNISLNFLFEICFTFAQKIGIGSLEDFKNWFEQGHAIEVGDQEIRFI